MDERVVDINGFVCYIRELDGHRFFETLWPEEFPYASLASIGWRYVELWDEEPGRPTVTAADLTRVRQFRDDDLAFVRQFLLRLAQLPNYVAGVWYAGSNEAAASAIRDLHVEVTGSDRGIFTTREEAVACLRRAIAKRSQNP